MFTLERGLGDGGDGLKLLSASGRSLMASILFCDSAKGGASFLKSVVYKKITKSVQDMWQDIRQDCPKTLGPTLFQPFHRIIRSTRD